MFHADKLIIGILKLKLVRPLQHSVRLLQSATDSACWFSAVHACAPNTHVWVVYVWAATEWLQWLAPCLSNWHRLLGKLLYGRILSSIKSRGEMARPTQFVRCVELKLNTSATQIHLRNHLAYPPRVGRETATCCRCQPKNDRAGGDTASTELNRVLLHWI